MRFSRIFTTTIALAITAPVVGCGNNEALLEQNGVTSGGGGESGDCTRTQGYWKNHEEAWPVSSLTLGTVVYSQAQLLAIFNQPVQGNGLIALAHQLIAAKLNIASGADSTLIAGAIADADALIGGLIVPPVGTGYLPPSSTSALNDELDEFNNTSDDNCAGDTPRCGDGELDMGEGCDDGNTMSGDGCSATCEVEFCGDGVVQGTEQCDDGNSTPGDGCSPTCTIEKTPCCGDGIVDMGEECDDGNTSGGDGCSATCQNEDPPCCGDGILQAGEECDDGNTSDGDGCSAVCEIECNYDPTVYRCTSQTFARPELRLATQTP